MARRIITRPELIIIIVCVVFGLQQYNLIRTFFSDSSQNNITSFQDAPAVATLHRQTPRGNNSNSNTFKGVNDNNSSSRGNLPRQCTIEELGVIKRQLPPDDCYKYATQPWTQRCSLSYATRCPDAVWLEKHYTTKQQQQQWTQSSSLSSTTFLALFIGCNKGFDALNALRMFSNNPTFDKSIWNTAMTYNNTIKLHNDVCNEITNPQFDIPLVSSTAATNNEEKNEEKKKNKKGFVQVHCIEPMPATAKELQRAALQTGYDTKGFIVTHAAMSRNDGYVAFPRESKVGVENKGISNADCKSSSSTSSSSSDDCVNVTMYSLDTYIKTYIPNNININNKNDEEDIPINYLSIDTEGWDYEILLGGKQNVLRRVHYLEFEYNWVGPWKKQSLLQVIEYLNTNLGFTCYWAGFNNTIWRITNCWLDHYESHFWSNIACVNRNIVDVQDIATDMENTFMETLAQGDKAVRDYTHRFQRNSN